MPMDKARTDVCGADAWRSDQKVVLLTHLGEAVARQRQYQIIITMTDNGLPVRPIGAMVT
jgi:hypothetical protein